MAAAHSLTFNAGIAGSADAWECLQCTFVNDAELLNCELCIASKGSTAKDADCEVVHIDAEAPSSKVPHRTYWPNSRLSGVFHLHVGSIIPLTFIALLCPPVDHAEHKRWSHDWSPEADANECRKWWPMMDRMLVQAVGSRARTCTSWTLVAAGTAGTAAVPMLSARNVHPFVLYFCRGHFDSTQKFMVSCSAMWQDFLIILLHSCDCGHVHWTMSAALDSECCIACEA